MLVNWPFGPEWAGPMDLTPGGVSWTDEVTTIGTPVIIAVTAFFALRQIRESERSRYAALAADLTRRWDEPPMVASRKAMITHTHEEIRDIIAATFEEGTTEAEADSFYTLQALPNFIETLAAIEYEFGGLSLDFIDRLWGSAIISSWGRWSLTVDFVRDQPNGENAFKNFERLVDVLETRRAEQTSEGAGVGQSASPGAQA
jgi:hypothetical protein